MGKSNLAAKFAGLLLHGAVPQTLVCICSFSICFIVTFILSFGMLCPAKI